MTKRRRDYHERWARCCARCRHSVVRIEDMSHPTAIRHCRLRKRGVLEIALCDAFERRKPKEEKP